VSTAGTRRRRSWTQLTWSQNQRAQAGRDAGERDGDTPLHKGTGYEVFSYLVAGMIAYGFIGWLVGRAVHVQMLFPIGAVVGLALSLGWVVYHYGIKGGGQ
jgi:ATP synthase protein I